MNENKGNKINYKINQNKRSIARSTSAPKSGSGTSHVRGNACKHVDIFKWNVAVWPSFKTKNFKQLSFSQKNFSHGNKLLFLLSRFWNKRKNPKIHKALQHCRESQKTVAFSTLLQLWPPQKKKKKKNITR